MSNFKSWVKDVALRAVKTAAQAAAAVVTANTAGVTHLNLAEVGSVAGLAALACVLQNLSNLKVNDPTLVPINATAGATLVPDVPASFAHPAPTLTVAPAPADPTATPVA